MQTTMKFNGKRYVYAGSERFKQAAKQRAARMRANGWLVRVVLIGSHWRLYRRADSAWTKTQEGI